MLFLKIKSINFLNLPAFISLSKYSIFYYYYFHYRPTDKIHVHHNPLYTQNMKKKIKQKQILHGKKKNHHKELGPWRVIIGRVKWTKGNERFDELFSALNVDYVL